MLNVEHISVSYGAVQALRDVSLSIGVGEVVTIIGGNGAGKSTLMRAISGLVPVSGAVRFKGVDVVSIRAIAVSVSASLMCLKAGRCFRIRPSRIIFC